MDYRALLAKYIAHVGEEEGYAYIEEADPNSLLGPRNPRNRVKFTPEEFAALDECAGEAGQLIASR